MGGYPDLYNHLLGRYTSREHNSVMTDWLKLIGSYKEPITAPPFNGRYTQDYVEFRKKSKPRIEVGDRLFLYAPGGSRRIFALAEAVGNPEPIPEPSSKPGSCHWKIPVRYVENLNLPVASGILIDDVISHRKVKLTKAFGQKSHIELRLEEIESAYHLLHEKDLLHEKSKP